MEGEISEKENNVEKKNNNYIEEFSINNFSLLKEIDKIIYNSKNQLEEIQFKKLNDNYYQYDNSIDDDINNKTYNKNNITYNNENISSDVNLKDNYKINNNQNTNDIDKNFDLERINLKLMSDLTLERVKVHDLTLKLKLKEKEILSLKQQINYTQMNLYNKQKRFENILEQNDKKNQQNFKKIIIKNQDDKIVKSFFNFYNKYIKLLNETNIISDNYNMLLYNDNDTNDINEENAQFALQKLESLIETLIKEKKELSDRLKKFEDIDNNKDKKIDFNDVINIENIKSDNIMIKEEALKPIEENNNFKNDNVVLSGELLNMDNIEKESKNNENLDQKEASQNNNEIIVDNLIETFGNIENTEIDEKDINNIKDENNSTIKNDNIEE